MANFLLKFRNFRYHGNRGWCDTNFFYLHSYIRRPRKPYVLCKNWKHISSTRKVIANFLLKFSKFSLPWQQGSSEQSLTDTIQLADPENPLLHASIWAVTPAQGELQPILCLKSQIFVTMATRVCLSQIGLVCRRLGCRRLEEPKKSSKHAYRVA